MFELIPSQYMRECYRELNFTFTDFQKATLIWNSPGKKRQEILDALLEICKEPLHFELILKQVFERFALTMDYSQYVLIGSTIRSYLSYLVDQGKVECYVEDALLLWKTAE